MPKYYIHSGDLKVCIEGDTPTDAAIKAVSNCEWEKLGIIMTASERGPDSIEDDDIVILTTHILKKAGLISEYEEEKIMKDILGDKYENL